MITEEEWNKLSDDEKVRGQLVIPDDGSVEKEMDEFLENKDEKK